MWEKLTSPTFWADLLIITFDDLALSEKGYDHRVFNSYTASQNFIDLFIQLEESSRHQEYLNLWMNKHSVLLPEIKIKSFALPQLESLLWSPVFFTAITVPGLDCMVSTLGLPNNFHILGDKVNATQQAEKLVWAS